MAVNWLLNGVPTTPDVALGHGRTSAVFTLTVPLPPVYPAEDAVMVAEPKFTPVTCTAGDGVVAPGAIVTLAGTVATPVLLLCSMIVAPSSGAGEDSCRLRGAEAPADTEVVGATETLPSITTAKGAKLTRA